jgi:hypothetical protein
MPTLLVVFDPLLVARPLMSNTASPKCVSQANFLAIPIVVSPISVRGVLLINFRVFQQQIKARTRKTPPWATPTRLPVEVKFGLISGRS